MFNKTLPQSKFKMIKWRFRPENCWSNSNHHLKDDSSSSTSEQSSGNCFTTYLLYFQPIGYCFLFTVGGQSRDLVPAAAPLYGFSVFRRRYWHCFHQYLNLMEYLWWLPWIFNRVCQYFHLALLVDPGIIDYLSSW